MKQVRSSPRAKRDPRRLSQGSSDSDEDTSVQSKVLPTQSRPSASSSGTKSQYDQFIDKFLESQASAPAADAQKARQVAISRDGRLGGAKRARSEHASAPADVDSSVGASGHTYAGLFDHIVAAENAGAGPKNRRKPEKRLKLAREAERLTAAIWEEPRGANDASLLSRSAGSALAPPLDRSRTSALQSGHAIVSKLPAEIARLRAEQQAASARAVASAPNETYVARTVAADPGTIMEVTMHNFMCHKHLKIQFGKFVTFIVGRNGSGKSAVCLALQLLMDKTVSLLRTTKQGRKFRQVKRRGAQGSRCYVEMVICNRKSKHGGTTLPYNHELYGDYIRIQRRLGDQKQKWQAFLIWGEKHEKLRLGKGVGELNVPVEAIRGKDADLELDAISQYFQFQPQNPVVFLTQDRAKALAMSSSRHKYELFLAATEAKRSIDRLDAVRKRLERTEGDLVALQITKVGLQHKMVAAKEEWEKVRKVDNAEAMIPRLRLHIGEMQFDHTMQQLKRIEEKQAADATRLRMVKRQLYGRIERAEELDGEALTIDLRTTSMIKEVEAKQVRAGVLERQIEMFQTRLERVNAETHAREQEATEIRAELRLAQQKYDDACAEAGIPPADSDDESTDWEGDRDPYSDSDASDGSDGSNQGLRKVKAAKKGAARKGRSYQNDEASRDQDNSDDDDDEEDEDAIGHEFDSRGNKVLAGVAEYERLARIRGLKMDGRVSREAASDKMQSPDSEDSSGDDAGAGISESDLAGRISSVEAKTASRQRKLRRIDAKQRRVRADKIRALASKARAEMDQSTYKQNMVAAKRAAADCKARLRKAQQMAKEGESMASSGGAAGTAGTDARATHARLATVASMMLGSAAGKFCLSTRSAMGDERRPIGPVGALLRLKRSHRGWQTAVTTALQGIVQAFRCSGTSDFKEARQIAAKVGFSADLRAFGTLDAAEIVAKTSQQTPTLIDVASSESLGAASSAKLPFLVSDAIAVFEGASDLELRCALHALHSHGNAHRVAVVETPDQARDLLAAHPKLLRCVLADGSAIIGRSASVTAAARLLAGASSPAGRVGLAESGMYLRPTSLQRSLQICIQSQSGDSSADLMMQPLREAFEAAEEAEDDCAQTVREANRRVRENSKILASLNKHSNRLQASAETIEAAVDRSRKQLEALRKAASGVSRDRTDQIAKAKEAQAAVMRVQDRLAETRRQMRRHARTKRDTQAHLKPALARLADMQQRGNSKRDIRRLEDKALSIRKEADVMRTEATTAKHEYDRIFSRREARKERKSEFQGHVTAAQQIIEDGWRAVLGEEYDAETKEGRLRGLLDEGDKREITKELLLDRLRSLESLKEEAKQKERMQRRLQQGKPQDDDEEPLGQQSALLRFRTAQKRLQLTEQRIEIASRLHRTSSKVLGRRHRNMLRLVEDAQAQIKLQFRRITRHFPFKRAELVWQPDDDDDPTRCGCLYVQIIPFSSDRATDGTAVEDGDNDDDDDADAGEGEDDDEEDEDVDERMRRQKVAPDDGTRMIGPGSSAYQGHASSKGALSGAGDPAQRADVLSGKTLGIMRRKGTIYSDWNSMERHTVLSGGEKSAVSVGLCLALAGQVETPIRVLDEFDVYQDEQSRQVSMGVLLEGAFLAACNGQQNGHQTVLLTPHDVSSAPIHRYPSGFVTVYKMPDPLRQAIVGQKRGRDGGGANLQGVYALGAGVEDNGDEEDEDGGEEEDEEEM